MNWNMVINIAAGAVLIISWFLLEYFRTSAKFRGFVAELIADAEWVFSEVEKAGKAKMDWVISKLYERYIPAFFKPFFTESKLRETVQMVFDKVKDFSDLQVERLKAAYDTSLIIFSLDTNRSNALLLRVQIY